MISGLGVLAFMCGGFGFGALFADEVGDGRVRVFVASLVCVVAGVFLMGVGGG